MAISLAFIQIYNIELWTKLWRCSFNGVSEVNAIKIIAIKSLKPEIRDIDSSQQTKVHHNKFNWKMWHTFSILPIANKIAIVLIECVMDHGNKDDGVLY